MMDLFTGMSQDEMKKLDEVLQSDHAKALLQETAVSHGANDVGVLMSTGIESLSTLSDLDNLEPTISVPTDVDVVNIASEIFYDSISKPVESYVLQEHSYSVLSQSVKTDLLDVINSEGIIKDSTFKAIDAVKNEPLPQVNGSSTSIQQLQKQLEKDKLDKEEEIVAVGVESSKVAQGGDLDFSESKLTNSKFLSEDKLLALTDIIQQYSDSVNESTKNIHTNECTSKVIGTTLSDEVDSKINKLKLDELNATSDNDVDDVEALENAVVSMLTSSVSSTDVFPSKNTNKAVRRSRVKSADSKPVSPVKEKVVIVNRKKKLMRRNTVNSHFPVNSNLNHEVPLNPGGIKQALKRTLSQDKGSNSVPQKKSDLAKAVSPKRKKSLSFSEDKSGNKPVEGKKRHFSEKDILGPSKMALVKPKVKPRKRIIKNEPLTADLLGPALFSQPDVLVKVKLADEVDDTKKQSKVPEEDKAKEPERKSVPNELGSINKAEVELSQKASTPLQKPSENAAKDSTPDAELLADLKGIMPEAKKSSTTPVGSLTVSTEESKNLSFKKQGIPLVSPVIKTEEKTPQRGLALKSQKCTPANIKDFLTNKNKEKSSSEDDDAESSSDEDSSESDQELAPKEGTATPKGRRTAVTKTPVIDPPKPERKSQRTIQRNKRFDEDYSPERPTRGRKNQTNKNATNQKAAEEEAPANAAIKPAARRRSGRAVVVKVESEEDSDDDSDNDDDDDDDKEDVKEKSKPKKASKKSDSSEEEEESEEYDSDDDPDKIWCLCRQPHNNKFMIQCDKCKDWFHGTCVNVTRQLGRQLEKERKEWVCPNCPRGPALKKRGMFHEGPSDADKAIKRPRNFVKKEEVEVTKNAATPQSKKTPEPIRRKTEDIKPNGANVKIPPPSREIKKEIRPPVREIKPPAKEIKPPVREMKPPVKEIKVSPKPVNKSPENDKNKARNLIPKDFVLKSRDPTSGKRGLKDDKSAIDVGQPEKIQRRNEPLTPKVEKTVLKPNVKIERSPVKTERDLKPNVLVKSETPKVSPDNQPRRKILLREVTLLNNKVIKERSLVAVQHEMNVNLKEKVNELPVATPTTGSLRNMNDKPKSVFKSSVLAMKEAKKEAIKRRYSCVLCLKPAPSGSVYCGTSCLEKCVVDAIKVIQSSLKPNEELNSRKVDMIDREKGNYVTGPTAPTVAELLDWLRSNQMFSIVQPVVPVISRKEQTQKSEPKPSERSDDEEAAKESIRVNVRNTLKKALLDRCATADDIKLTEDQVQKISLKTEKELHNYFKDNSFKYRAKYRSLMFNIKDPRNQGLFRKILKGSIPPDQLVRMSTEELASVELAKWREMENQHSLEMIKRMQTEQSQGLAGLRKKTHKGEIEIEDDGNIGLDKPKSTPIDVDKEVPKASPRPAEETIEVVPEKKEKIEEKETEKDTTMMHRSHLFDLNCKICTGKMAPPPPEESTPKKIRVAHSISVEQTSPKVSESEARPRTSRTSMSEMSDDSIDREPSSAVFGSPDSGCSGGKRDTSIWKGSIMMQDVTKFFSSACKVSGSIESLFTNIPDNLQVCGRINPQQVWEYLSRVKQSGRQELVIISFHPANDEEAITYNVFYNYLNSRKRCGVINQNFSKLVKDFYILPLAAHKPVPTVLLPFDGPGLSSHRPHLLLGVLVRHRSKQKDAKTETNINQERIEEASYTPPRESISYTPPLNNPSLNNPSYTPPLDSINITPPPGCKSLTPPLEERSYTPPLEEQSYTPPLEERSYTPPMDDQPYTPPSQPHLDDRDNVVSGYNSKSFTSVGITRDEKQSDDMESYEPSYTPPLEGMPKASKSNVGERPYKPIPITTDFSRCKTSDSGKNVITEIMRKLQQSSAPAVPSAPSDIERQKVILNDLISKVQEVDLKMNQSIDDFEKLKAMSHGEQESQEESTNTIAKTGMSSFLTLPKKNLQDILNSVKSKPQFLDSRIPGSNTDTDIRCLRTLDTDFRSFVLGGKDTDIRTLPNYSPGSTNDPESPDFPMADVDDRNSSPDATPPFCGADDDEKPPARELRPSDPRIKIRTNFAEESSPSDELKNKSLSKMSTSELVERAQKELEAIAPPSNFPVPNWDNCKEPPPPGIDPSDLSPTERASFQRSNPVAGFALQPPLPDVTSPFGPATPTTPTAFSVPPPGYPLLTPPPGIDVITSFPPPVLPPGFIPPPPMVQPPDGRDKRNDPYFQYHGRPSHWKEREYGDFDHHGRPEDEPSEGWYYSRSGHSGRDRNNTRRPWREGNSRFAGRGLRRQWSPRRTRSSHRDRGWRGRSSYSHPPQE